ncbi:short-chain dehydrogenase [Roseivirga sp. 4D4]|uniref:SDR family NAD(P)-dependent oxidoreductase n=1 Tax=Roseivirga sp. 4D4 TaxID=1889784 RepID=UPI000852C8B3|nr:SDR family NAD(P)-dependent oxidoreductase [Roseivirga sp. 4D4]OEK03693.1 short-chain dehydrogenase [Roseivirga sp. 4D4]
MKLSRQKTETLKTDYGNWVLITGATSGIGKEMAITFAKAGFNLIITGRREKQLTDFSTELFDQYKVEVIPVIGDLSIPSEVEKLIEATAHLPIGIVVLNAGFGTSGKFIESDLETELNLLDLNCRSVLQMSHHFAQQMKSESRKGAIVLLSSMVAFQGVPNAANYAASKAYVQSFGEALSRELKPEGIDVLCAAPGPVESGFAERAKMKMNMSLKTEDICVPIINSIGKKTTILPGFLTKFLVYNLRMVPRWAKVRIMENVMAGFTKHQGH